MNEPGRIEERQLFRRELVAAVAAGSAVGLPNLVPGTTSGCISGASLPIGEHGPTSEHQIARATQGGTLYG